MQRMGRRFHHTKIKIDMHLNAFSSFIDVKYILGHEITRKL